MSRGWIVAAAVILASCSAPTQPSATSDAAIAARVAGSWTQQGLVVGAAFTMQLAANGQVLSGTGHYAIEAGRSGTLTETGNVINARIHLDFTYDSGQLAQFDGTLVDDRTLSGSMHTGPPQSLTPSVLVTFTKS